MRSMALILNVCSSRQNPLMEIKRRELYTHRYTPCVSKCTYQPFTAHPSFSKELNLKVLVSTFVQWGLSHFVYLIGCLCQSSIKNMSQVVSFSLNWSFLCISLWLSIGLWTKIISLQWLQGFSWSGPVTLASLIPWVLLPFSFTGFLLEPWIHFNIPELDPYILRLGPVPLTSCVREGPPDLLH